MTRPQDILDFWFDGDPSVPRTAWFQKDAVFDATCARFADARDQAKAGTFDHWTTTPSGTLALLILLDQLSRNLHRGSAEAFTGDPKALGLARAAVARGDDRALAPFERMFLYLPFEHAEDLAAQNESVRLFESIREPVGADTVNYAYRHRDVIRRFGRFPHRNAALGRTNTPEEEEYLAQPGAGF